MSESAGWALRNHRELTSPSRPATETERGEMEREAARSMKNLRIRRKLPKVI